MIVVLASDLWCAKATPELDVAQAEQTMAESGEANAEESRDTSVKLHCSTTDLPIASQETRGSEGRC